MIKHILEFILLNFLLPWSLGFLLVLGLMEIMDGIFNWWRARKIKRSVRDREKLKR